MTVGRITHPAASAARVATDRISPNASRIVQIGSSKATRRLFEMGPDPAETKRFCDENSRNEQQRVIDRYGFDPISCRTVNGSSLSSSSSSSGGSGGSGSSAGAAAAAASQMRHQPFHHHHRQ